MAADKGGKTKVDESPEDRIATALENIVGLLGSIHHELFQLRKLQTGPATTGKKPPI